MGALDSWKLIILKITKASWKDKVNAHKNKYSSK
jgi:hypothetical protein